MMAASIRLRVRWHAGAQVVSNELDTNASISFSGMIIRTAGHHSMAPAEVA